MRFPKPAPPCSPTSPAAERHGTVLAARTTRTRCNRALPHCPAPARPAAVRRAGSPPHADPFRRHVDRRQRTGDLASRTRPLPGRLPADRARRRGCTPTHRPHHYPPRPRRDSVVHRRRPGRRGERAAWTYTGLPEHASVLAGHVAFAWRAMDGFYEEDERILGHAADNYHRVDIRSSSRRLVVRAAGTTIADTTAPVVLYESGFAPRWYVPRTDVDETALTATQTSTFCPYKGIAATTASPESPMPRGSIATPSPRPLA